MINALTSSPGNRDVRVHDELPDGGKNFNCPKDKIFAVITKSNDVLIVCDQQDDGGGLGGEKLPSKQVIRFD